MNKVINWKIFFILLCLSIFSLICVFPYVLTLQGDLLKQVSLPVSLIFFVQLIQSSILFSIAIFFGLFFIKRTGFRIPVITAIINKENYKQNFKEIIWVSVLYGFAAAAVIFLSDFLFGLAGSTISTHQHYAPVWQTLLAAFYGGTSEEILTRLFLMTLFIWIGMKVFKLSKPTNAVIMTSLIFAAILFGLGHLPITASLTSITPLIITRAIVLNGIGGIVFGLLFWKKGFESAMIAHFVADVFLLTVFPLISTQV